MSLTRTMSADLGPGAGSAGSSAARQRPAFNSSSALGSSGVGLPRPFDSPQRMPSVAGGSGASQGRLRPGALLDSPEDLPRGGQQPLFRTSSDFQQGLGMGERGERGSSASGGSSGHVAAGRSASDEGESSGGFASSGVGMGVSEVGVPSVFTDSYTDAAASSNPLPPLPGTRHHGHQGQQPARRRHSTLTEELLLGGAGGEVGSGGFAGDDYDAALPQADSGFLQKNPATFVVAREMAKLVVEDLFLPADESFPQVIASQHQQDQPRQSSVVFAHGNQEAMQLQALPEKIRFVSVAFNDYLKPARDLQAVCVSSPSAVAACPGLSQAVARTAESAAIFDHVFVPELNSLIFQLAALSDLCFAEPDPSQEDIKACIEKLEERVEAVSKTSKQLSRLLTGSGGAVAVASRKLKSTEVETLNDMAELDKREKRDSKRSFWLGFGGAALLLLGAPLIMCEAPAIIAGAAISGARVGAGVAAVVGAGASAGGSINYANKAAQALTIYRDKGEVLEGVQRMKGPARSLSDSTGKLVKGLEKVDFLLTMLTDRVSDCLKTPGTNLSSLALFKLLQLAQAVGVSACYLPAHEVEVDMLLGDREAADVVRAWKLEQRDAEVAAAASAAATAEV
ncbi:unnamed protein product [Closterium sp. Yama58-4]|nr:unnamed protein product [Closterium sp. Yama58-4]